MLAPFCVVSLPTNETLIHSRIHVECKQGQFRNSSKVCGRRRFNYASDQDLVVINVQANFLLAITWLKPIASERKQKSIIIWINMIIYDLSMISQDVIVAVLANLPVPAAASCKQPGWRFTSWKFPWTSFNLFEPNVQHQLKWRNRKYPYMRHLGTHS